MARNRGGGAYGRTSIPGKLAYGTQEEIDARTEGTGAKSNRTDFKQIGPEDSGGDASNPSFKHLSGDWHFTPGV